MTTNDECIEMSDNSDNKEPHKTVQDNSLKKRMFITLFGMLCILILVAVIVVFYFVTKDKDSNNFGSCPRFFQIGGSVTTITDGTKKPLPLINDNCKIPHYDIVHDNLDIHKMLSMANKGDFNTIWPILEDKPYLINVIPEGESYALLHHAAIHNDMSAISVLVNSTACDVRVKSIPKGNDTKTGGKIPQNLTSDENIKRFLQKFTDEKMNERFSTPPIFFATKARGEKYNSYGLPVLLISLSAYKNTFVRNNTITPSMHFQNILRIVYRSPDSDFPDVENKIINAMYGYSASAAQDLVQSTSKDEFYSNIIQLYTGDSVYGEVNLLMKRQAFYNYIHYKPRGSTLSLGPYALMLDSVLTFWDELTPYTNLTYRGIRSDVSSHYHVGMEFVYLDFVSSTDDIDVAESFAGDDGSVFVMNNVQLSSWQPRYIAKYSKFPDEREYLYPPGAEFIVTRMEEQLIYLDLKNPKNI